MRLDLVTAAYKGGSAYVRAVPRPVADLTARVLSRTAASVSAERRMLVARHLRRAVGPQLTGRGLDRAVDATFDSYARYWVESFRLPGTAPAVLDAGMSVQGYEHVADGLAAGNGVILALPHMGGWEWAGFWLTQVMGVQVTVVVEPVEPPELFEFFTDFRSRLGFHIVPLGPKAASSVLRALRDNHIVCLLTDRDIVGDGIEVQFFGERTTIPAGPATLGLRTGAPVLPTAVYFDGPGHSARVMPPLAAARQGRLRDDVHRVTGTLAGHLEELIRAAPEQWHLQQPNWPSDYEALEAIGKPHPRPAFGPAALTAGERPASRPPEGPGADGHAAGRSTAGLGADGGIGS
jgi:lauroyl/myristoyl acyltransferase